jgi:hypothetical protein
LLRSANIPEASTVNLSSNINKLPCTPTLGWFGDFDNEADNPDHIMRTVVSEDRHSLDVHPLRAVVAPDDAELARCMLGAIRPKRLHRDLVKNTPILRMHTPQEQMEFSGHIAVNSENMPQLVGPILLACVKINVEEANFLCSPTSL